MPKVRSLDQIKLNLLQPALTSHFEVEIFSPPGLTNEYLSANGVTNALFQDKLNLLCSETVLPGSSIATLELNNQYHGATVRHAYRRLYDDRIDLTFYVSAEDYLPIRYFETWIKYVVGENISGSSQQPSTGRPGSKDPQYFYRVNYPKNYISPQGLKITKFERTGGTNNLYSGGILQYEFINVFPIAISSMPISYDSSSLLKCTVSLSYLRYIMSPTSNLDKPSHEDEINSSPSSTTTGDPSSPANQAIFNNAQFVPTNNTLSGLEGTGALAVGGVSQSAALASGNSITYSDISRALSEEASLF
jgi:hypothetical protein